MFKVKAKTIILMVFLVACTLLACTRSARETQPSPTRAESPTNSPSPFPKGRGAAFRGVGITDNHFDEAHLSVGPGIEVEGNWLFYEGVNPHSVTSDDGLFDSSPNCPPDCLKPDPTQVPVFRHVFTLPGVYAYYCKIYGGPGGNGMSGTITLQRGAIR